MPHVLNWFEIPGTDVARAQRFCEAVLGISIAPMVMGPMIEIGNNFGYFAHFIDTEGNKVGLHSMS